MKSRFLPRAAACLLLLSLLASCHPARADQIANSRSRLLTALVQEADFTGDWVWLTHTVDQEGASYINRAMVESASESLAGRYRPDGALVVITHRLVRYKDPLGPAPTGLPTSAPLTPLPGLFPMGHYRIVDCDSPQMAECQIVASYQNIVSTLIISTVTGDSPPQEPPALDQMLERVDGRIRQVDGPRP